MRIIKILLLFVLSVICFVLGFYCNGLHQNIEIQNIEKVDTTYIYYPIEIERRIVKKDTIKIAVIDTLVVRDTLYLPREQKVYADSSYRAVVSGVSPRLDSIEVYQRTVEITKVSTRKEWRRFTYGVQAGVGVVMPFSFSLSSSLSSSPSLGVYVGVGIGYNF